MQKKLLLLVITAILTTGTQAQNIKAGIYALKYEVLPQFPLSPEYKNYTIEAFSGATDGVPLSSKLIYLKEKYIEGLENVTSITIQQGIIAGNKTIDWTKEPPKTKTQSDLQITVIMMNLEVTDKKYDISKRTNLQTNAIEDYSNYKMTFKFPYQLIIKDLKLNKTIVDTIRDTPKTTLFPADYRYNAFGDKVAFNGHPNKVELDLDYSKNANTIYQLSKQTLAKNVMNEVKSILNSYYGYNYSQHNIMLYRIKSKNKIFDVCDTILENIKNIIDSVKYNYKKETHLNWHTTPIKSITRKTIPLAEKMIADPIYLNEFENNSDKEEYIIKMKRNLIVLYLFNDDFDKAQKLLGNYVDDETIADMKNLITREIKLYNKHKTFFGFN